ncbi:WXG100 family type VII secretion target [Paenibacillus lactis]|uniref:WXG100 family type VII secretion target n=1 Tax=Paenibacillus lactis 154 TaxID=743719 RepID=G4HIY1_9BACL|nr:WXG100 family type VII secretion target [Paenibacillus lactis]EHB62699.1 hypothetical protein PaelaDRAFT_3942 [Paenibacillus lactis 154]
MSRILVTPEMLLRVAEQCSRAHEQLEAMIYMLKKNIHMLESAWEGTTRSRFYADFQQAHREMTQTTEHIHRTSLELRGIAQRFKSADERVQPIQVAGHVLGTFPMMRGPSGYSAVEDAGRKAEEAWNSVQQEAGKAWDTVKQEAGELWEGVKIGAAQLGNSLKDTGISLYEDPLGTGKEMLYNATIGTVEEIWNTGMWAGRMLFSNEYREKVAEDVKAEVDSAGGWSNYLGQAAALIVGEVILNRAGIRGRGPLNKKHDDRGGGNSGGSSGGNSGGSGGNGGGSGNGGGNGSGSGGGNDSGDRGGDCDSDGDSDGNKSGDEGAGNGVDVSRDTIFDSATQAKKGGETVVGHALQKHAGRNPDIWGNVKGGPDQINEAAKTHLEEIVDGPGGFVEVTNNRGITFLEKKLPDGRGVRLNLDGTFKGFIDQ